MTKTFRTAKALLAAGIALSATAAYADPGVWEANYGTAVISGDDNVATNVALSIAFPFLGTTYNAADVSTNGFIQLGGNNGSGCCTGDVGGLLSGYARIAPQWFDHVGTVYQNDDVAGRTVYTWATTEFGFGGSFATQLQLFDDGRFEFGFNGPSVPAGHTSLTGYSSGGGAADPGAVNFAAFSSPWVSGNSAYQLFVNNTFNLNQANVFFTPDGDGTGFSISTVGFVNGAVPEPATWAMMIGGFGLVGGAMRRRAKTSVAFAA